MKRLICKCIEVKQEYGEKQPVIDAKTRRKINQKLYEISKAFHAQIPIQKIFNALEEYEVVPLQEDNTIWSGMLLGESGRATINIASKYSKTDSTYRPYTNTMLILLWHKTDSRYEITAYLS